MSKDYMVSYDEFILKNEKDDIDMPRLIEENENLKNEIDKINNNYVSYNGGRDAQYFFESFAKIDGSKDILFKYRDNEMKIAVIRKNITAFALDIEYSSEDYSAHMNEIWNSTNMPDKAKSENYYGSFLMTYVTLNEYVYLVVWKHTPLS